LAASCNKDSTSTLDPLVVTVTPANPRLTPGTEVQLSATVTGRPGLNQLFDWTSSQPSVATVSIQGLVTTLREGSTVITATWNSDSTVTGTARVDVTEEIAPAGDPAASTTVRPADVVPPAVVRRRQ
jgi:alpha-amylase